MIVGWQEKDTIAFTFNTGLFASPKLLLDKDSQQLISQYTYCKEWNVPPYTGGFFQQPAYWVEAVKIIGNEIDKASEYKMKMEHK